MNTNSLKHIVLFFILCIGAITTHAQTKVTTQFDAKQIMIGDQVRMFISVTKENNDQLQWATIPDTFNTLEIVEKGQIDTIKISGRNVQYKQRLLITGFDSGAYLIPAFEFTVTDKAGASKILTTDSLLLSIQTVAVDTTKPFKDIKEIREVELTWIDYAEAIWVEQKEVVIGGGLILLLVGFIIYILLKRKKKKPSQPNEAAFAKAERLLAELDAKQLWQQGDVKLYYIELTDIFRSYLEEQFGMSAMELTTDELLASMRQNRLLKKNRSLIKEMLRTADMAKFAKAQPSAEEHIDAMEKTKSFIKATKPTPQLTNNTKKP